MIVMLRHSHPINGRMRFRGELMDLPEADAQALVVMEAAEWVGPPTPEVPLGDPSPVPPAGPRKGRRKGA